MNTSTKLNPKMYILTILMVFITNITVMNAQVIIEKTTVCQNKYQLDAGANAGKGKWQIKKGNGYFRKQNAAVTTVKNISAGNNTYVWKGFFKEDRIIEIDNKSISVKLLADAEICSSLFEFTIKDKGDGTLKFYMGGNAINPHKDELNKYVLTNISVGKHQLVVVKSNESCSVTDTFNFVHTHIEAQARLYLNAKSSEVVLKAAVSTGVKGWWESSNKAVAIQDKNDPNTRVNYLKAGRNTFTWTVCSGSCLASIKTVVFYDDMGFGKLQNTEYELDLVSGRLILPEISETSNNLPNNEIWIFNSFGELVYNVTPYRGTFTPYRTIKTESGYYKPDAGQYYFYFKPDTNSETVLYNEFEVVM